MATTGRPEAVAVKAEGMRVAVISTQWNSDIVGLLHQRALDVAKDAGAHADEYFVSGAMELPVVAQACAQRYDAVVALGCVIRGETPHFDYVCDSVTAGLTRIALDEQTPVGNGVLTVNNHDQAVARAGGGGAVEDKGAEAMRAALGAAVELEKVRTLPVE
ncbi:6,7-dimethyl-8-ribityllumazine synthase [Corynebacterium cystitidis]|uniref:6,7-dimethyl-8-ribityllumazine synthase n=1 Tax=Corynebacterium cystitidis DSM 20524 TaxID=1121357 RepID=A0A1H9PHP9_9CORY|nr:6,7-dimethyl-8-ribityllumazine synthase [Corynebacterium cystitidis]WJY82489.1 6,7-dimethyl-8-ribityllumazine synthase [Corynebacterium cystitidis DSM 20524]SER47741.1 6,7-dimethyl-8-ribityllumazine synthase [Corynebacterium cystitidis DSM 20524]SNV75184.1 6,7-dimethyl-8-ribityllumazine synthase [Corynebacterium cystitidis]